MNRKCITIHKRNEIIRGSDSYSLNGRRCFNAIYYIYQRNFDMFLEAERIGVTRFNIKFSTLRKHMFLENDNSYVQKIKDAIYELQTTLIELNNFTDHTTGEKHMRYSTKFIDYASISNNKITFAEIEISKLFRILIRYNVNFTKLNLTNNLSNMRTKIAMKLYEYIKSFGGYRYIDITHKHMCYLLGIDENSNQAYMSYMSAMLNRNISEIIKKSDLKNLMIDESKELRKDKVFRIHINKSSKKTSKKSVDDIVKELADMKRILI